MVLGLKTLFAEDGVRQVDYTFTPDEALLAGCSPIHVTGKLEGKSSIVYMTLTAAFTLSLLCDRCLTPYEEAHTVPVEHVLVTSLNREDNDCLLYTSSGVRRYLRVGPEPDGKARAGPVRAGKRRGERESHARVRPADS